MFGQTGGPSISKLQDLAAACALHNQIELLYRNRLSNPSWQSAMLYRSLGNTGLRVSEVGFGCASYWGKKIFDETAAIRLVHAAVDHGVTFFDTGASYSAGNAEPRLGRALSGLKNKHDLVIATKAGSYTDQRGKRREDFSAAGIRRTVEASLVRLGLDAVPLLHLHGPEISDLTDDLLDTLIGLKQQGKLLHLGINSFDQNVIEHVMTIPLFASMMIDYNILRPEREPVIARLAERRLGIFAGMPLAGGLHLKGRFHVRGIQDVWYAARALKNHRSDIKRGRNLRFLEHEPQHPAAEIALAWVLRKPEISCAVLGTTRMSHLLANVRASGTTLSDELLQKIARAQLDFA